MTDQTGANGPNRRTLLGVTAGLATLSTTACAKPEPSIAPPPQAKAAGVVDLVLNINGQDNRVAVDPRASLLDTLREHLHLTGSKKGCDQGQCGACTVHVDGKRVLSCLTLALSAQGSQITTIEGIAGAGGALHPMQQAFIDKDGFQCGYCTPGQIMSAIACVQEGHANTDDDIREYMSGNLCRCAAYPRIVEAIREASGKMASNKIEAA